jgi:hypothetical protein
MNSIITTDDYFSQHTFANVEFTGVFERIRIRTVNNEAFYNIHLFIKYGDKVYMENYNIGHIVISFAELQKNKYWKHYYDLSLILTNNKHQVIKDIKYNSNFSYGPFEGYPIYYQETRLWWIDTAIIDSSIESYADHEITRNIENYGHLCYYKINPYDLENMEYTSLEYLNIFMHDYMTKRSETLYNLFEKNSVVHKELVISYNISLIEKELEELYVMFEDKKNVINLVTFYDKKDINYDVLMMIYNNLVSAEGNKKYLQYINIANTYKNKLEIFTQIMTV